MLYVASLKAVLFIPVQALKIQRNAPSKLKTEICWVSTFHFPGPAGESSLLFHSELQ